MRHLIALILLLLAPIGAQTTFPLQQYGSGGKSWQCTSVFTPTFHTGGEFPVLGNHSFQVISRNLRSGGPTVLLLSASKATLSYLKMSVLVDPVLGFCLLGKASGSGGFAGIGTATFSLPIPKGYTSLLGAPVYLQLFSMDSIWPDTWMHSQGLELNCCQSISKNITALYDQIQYQKYVTSAAVGQAVWQANAVKGFSYLNTQKYTCGGQSHWMVMVKDDTYGIEFMLIPGGSFRMGDISNTGGVHHSKEIPVHWVHIEPFLLARTEVTQGQWQMVMKSTPWAYGNPPMPKPHARIYPNYAASYITWDDSVSGAGSFCGKTGWRLPSESEWEYACRAGISTAYHFGSNSEKELDKYAWYGITNSSSNSYTHQVGVKLPNAFGLRDMHGNVWEWVQDDLFDNYKGAPVNGMPWKRQTKHRMIRGGGWHYSYTGDCRSAHRDSWICSCLDWDNGFRPAVSLK